MAKAYVKMTTEMMVNVRKLLCDTTCYAMDVDGMGVLQHISGFMEEEGFAETMHLYGHKWISVDGFVFIMDKDQHVLYAYYHEIDGTVYLSMWWVLEPNDLDDFMGIQF